MNKKIFIILCFLFVLSFTTFAVGFNDYKESKGEQITVKEIDGKKILFSMPSVKNSADLLSSKEKNLERLVSLGSGQEIETVITFSKPLSESELNQVMGGIPIRKVFFISSPEGYGSADYPLTSKEKRRLSALEVSVNRRMLNFCGYGLERALEKVPSEERELARTSFGKQCESYKNFRLVRGFVSAKGKGTKEDLLELANNPNVFLIDVGPIELLNEHPDAAIVVIKDRWYEYAKFIKNG